MNQALKTQLRQSISETRKALLEDFVASESQRLIARLEQMTVFQNASVVMMYYPICHEVNLLALLDAYASTKTFLFPKVVGQDMTSHPYRGAASLQLGSFHIPEPVSEPYTGPIPLILVPGIAFDEHGARLGRGGGFYDRFLSLHRESVTIGVGFDFQLVENVPVAVWDVPMHYILTPSTTIAVPSVSAADGE